jgi:luciferase family oxidoreductase group 1
MQAREPRLKLSVLDQSTATVASTHAQSIRNTLDLAQHCEALGYERFWLSEHHSHPSIVGSAPEVLLAAVAARTQRIRIGSAGIMLPHYSALKVAEQFRVLDALAPGPVDMGVGRAPGSDQRTSSLLNPDSQAATHFPQQVLELQAWVQEGADLAIGAATSGIPQGHPGYGVHAYPHGPTVPTLWMLGSSDYGAQLAAHYGLPYAFAHFITDGQGAANALQIYRSSYKPSAQHPRPCVALCVWALAADTEDEAWHLFKTRERWKMDRQLGRIGELMAPDVAERAYSSAEQQALQTLRNNAIVGNASQVADKLQSLASALQVDEMVVITWAHDHAVQKHSYALLAQELIDK